ncbi:unnamed protein product [Ceratitis capitata]|uniref:(Mediterranean fruit fly) hypothetical protein n=1 Tax=Ceratitis capitata TaxID=7213 RepID=A0A811UK54_CERCA|nr:unnamed protein product [Ceratitis capitata]
MCENIAQASAQANRGSLMLCNIVGSVNHNRNHIYAANNSGNHPPIHRFTYSTTAHLALIYCHTRCRASVLDEEPTSICISMLVSTSAAGLMSARITERDARHAPGRLRVR